MSKKKTFVLILFVIIQQNLLPGDFSINAGVNHSWLFYPDISALENKFHLSYSVGVNINQEIFPNTKITFGLRLFNIGRYDEIQFNYLRETFKMNHTYIAFPIKVEYELIKYLAPFINIEPGIQVDTRFEHTTSLGRNDKEIATDEMNRFNIFAGAGIKYIFNLFEEQFSISGMINFGLIRISKDEQFDVTESSSRGWGDWRSREVLLNFEYYFSI